MEKRNIIAALLLLIVQVASGKEDMDLVRANYYYSHLSFSKAIPYYEKLAENGENALILSRLGDCYRLTGDIPKAAKWYRKALDKPNYGDIVALRYGQMLMQLQEYPEAKKWLGEYLLSNPHDKRVINLIAACEWAPQHINTRATGARLLDINTDHSEFGPTLWNGNLVYAADTAMGVTKKTSKWTGNACYNIYAIPCDESGNCSGDPRTLGLTKNMDISWHDGPCTFNKSGDTMYFTRTRYSDKFFEKGPIANKDNTVVLETMVATDYDEVGGKFGTVKRFVFNSDNYSVAHTTVSPNGRILVFSSSMLGSGSDLYICERTKNGKWQRPKRLSDEINTEGEEVFPYFVNDTTLSFSSDGHVGYGGLDLYTCHWDKKSQTFVQPTNVGMPINSSYDDISMALFADGSGGYFSSNRPAEKGADNIYFYKK